MTTFDPTDYTRTDDGRAILSCEDVSGTDFTDADLYGMEALNADFNGADLRWCSLADALADHSDFTEADLSGTCGLRLSAVGATFDNADMSHADWYRADLRRSDFTHACMAFTKLDGADLRGADLRGADLRYADLRGADLRYADLRGADMRHVDRDERTCWTGACVASAAMDDDLQAALDLDAMGYVLTCQLP